MKQAPLFRGVVIALALGLSLAADSDSAVSDPSKLSKPSARIEPEASSSIQRPKSSLPSAASSSNKSATVEGGPEAKAAPEDTVDPYQLFPPTFHQFLDIPMHTFSNGTAYEPIPTYSDSPSHADGANPPAAGSAAHDSPDYSYYDTGGPTGTAGSDSGSHSNHQTSNSNYRDTPSYSATPSKDQAYANYVASLTNNNKFGQQKPEQGYESQYEDDYENDYDGSYGKKVSDDKKKPGKASKPQLSQSSLSSGTGPQDLPHDDSPTKSKSSSKYSPSSKNKLQSTSQQTYSGINNYYSDSGSSRKPFKPSQPIKTTAYDDSGDSKPSIPLYAQATPSQGPKNHYQPSFSSSQSNLNSGGKSKKPSKPYVGTSSPSDATGPTSEASGPSGDEAEESGRDSYKSRPSSKPSKPSYSRPAEESSDYEHSDYDQGPAAKSPKSSSSGKGSRPFSSPVGGSGYGSPFGQQSPPSPNQPVSSSKFADGWKPISKPSAATSTSSENTFKEYEDGGFTSPKQPNSAFASQQPSFDAGGGRPGSNNGYDNAPNGEEESEGNEADNDSPAYDYYGHDEGHADGPSKTEESSRPSDQPESEGSASGPAASGPAASGPPSPGSSFNEGPSRPNKRPSVNDVGGKPPGKFGPPKFADKDKEKDVSAPVGDDFEFDEYSSEPVNKKPIGGRPGFGQGGPPARRPNKQGGGSFDDGPAFGRPAPNFGGNRPNQGKFHNPPGKRPGFGQGGQGGRPQRPLDDGRAPSKNNGPLSNEISDDLFDFDETPPRRPVFHGGGRPGGPGGPGRPGRPGFGGVRQRQQQKRPLPDDSQLYEDSDEFDNPDNLGPPLRRPQGGRAPGRRPNNRPVFNDDDDEGFFQGDSAEPGARRPGPNRRPNQFNRGPPLRAPAGRKRPEPDLEDNENGAPEPTANGGPPSTAPAEFLQPGGYPSEEDNGSDNNVSDDNDDGPRPSRPPFGRGPPRGPPRGRPFNAPPPRGREEGFGAIFGAGGRNQGNSRPTFLRQMFGGRRPFGRGGGGGGGGEQALRRRGQKRNRPGPDGDDVQQGPRRRPMNDQPRRRPLMNRQQRNPEGANKRHGGGFAQKFFAGLRVPRPQLIPQLNVGPLGFILSKRSSTKSAQATRQKRSIPPWVAHYALTPPQSVQNFIQQFYSQRSTVAKLTDGQNQPKSSDNRA